MQKISNLTKDGGTFDCPSLVALGYYWLLIVSLYYPDWSEDSFKTLKVHHWFPLVTIHILGDDKKFEV